MERYFLTKRDNRIFLVKTKIDDYTTFNPSNTDFAEITLNSINLNSNNNNFIQSQLISSNITYEYDVFTRYVNTFAINFYQKDLDLQNIVIYNPFDIIEKQLNINDINEIFIVFYTGEDIKKKYRVFSISYDDNIQDIIFNSTLKAGIHIKVLNKPLINYFKLYVKEYNTNKYKLLLFQDIKIKTLSDEILNIILDKTSNINVIDKQYVSYIPNTTILSEVFLISKTFSENIPNNYFTSIISYDKVNSTITATYITMEYNFNSYVFNENIQNNINLNNNFAVNNYNTLIASYLVSETSL